MKRNVFALCLLTLFLLTSMTGCGLWKKPAETPAERAARINAKDETERAVYLMEESIATMDQTSSRTRVTGDFAFTVNQISSTVKTVVEQREIIDADGKCSSVSRSETKTQIGDDEEKTETTVSGYTDGRMFLDTGAARMYTPMSAAEWREHQKEMASGEEEDPDFSACDEVSCSFTEDEGWNLHFSGMSAQTLRLFSLDDVLTDVFAGFTLQDITLTATINLDLTVKRMDLVFHYTADAAEESAEPPIVTMTVEVLETGDGVTAEEIDFSDYTEVNDLRAMERAQKQARDFVKRPSGTFSLSISQRSGQSSYTEQDKIKFSEKDGRFVYNISVAQNNYPYTISYEDGTQTVRYPTQSYSNPQTEEEARAYIKNLITGNQFLSATYDDITVDKTGRVYTATDSHPDFTKFGLSNSRAQGFVRWSLTFDKAQELTQIKLELTYTTNTGSLTLSRIVTF